MYGYFRLIKKIPEIQEIACAKIVAMATPATPQRNEMTNQRSSTTFSTQAIASKSNGVLLSPSDCIMALFRLYPKEKIVPIKIMTIYSRASEKALSGVLSTEATARKK